MYCDAAVRTTGLAVDAPPSIAPINGRAATPSASATADPSIREILNEEPMMRLARVGSSRAKASAARLVVAAPMTEQKKAT